MVSYISNMPLQEKKRLTSAQIIILGFSGVILLGALALMLPLSSRERAVTSFWDALFTATSAVCVTGLVVRDTAAYWSPFGQCVLKGGDRPLPVGQGQHQRERPQQDHAGKTEDDDLGGGQPLFSLNRRIV